MRDTCRVMWFELIECRVLCPLEIFPCSILLFIRLLPKQTLIFNIMGRLSRYAQDRILVLRSQQVKVGDIVQKLNEEGMPTTRQTVSRFLRVSSDGTKTRLNTEGGKQKERKSKLTKEQLDFINKEIEKDDKINARGIFLGQTASKSFVFIVSFILLLQFCAAPQCFHFLKTRPP